MKNGFTASLGAVAVFLCSCTWCDTHYVSLDGSDESPYLTPQTAASSIQSAVAVASARDTISIAPADYREHVLMQTGLVLVGSGAGATRIVGSVTAGPGTEIRYVTLTQEAVKGEAGYAPTGIEGPTTGGLTVVGCRISGTYETGVLCQMDGGYALIQDCEIRGIRTPPVGEGIGVWPFWGGRPLVCLVDGCVLEDNNCGLGAASSDGVWVMQTRFSANGTAIYVWDRAQILGCDIRRNLYGISVGGTGPVAIESSGLTFNMEWGLWCGDVSEVQLLNCTIAGNGRGVWLTYTEPYTQAATSCIIWGNAQDVGVEGLEPGWSSLMAEYCDIGGGWEGNENIDADPLFQGPEAGNFRLRPDSPCIDRGSIFSDDLYGAYDLDGKHRVVYGGKDRRVDIGAYEYHINRVRLKPPSGTAALIWSSRSNAMYSVFYTEDLLAWHLVEQNVPSEGDTITFWTDDGSKTGLAPTLAPRRFYRVLENP